MLEQYPKLKKILPFFPLFLLFAVGYYVYIRLEQPSLFQLLASITIWISIPITYYISRFVNNLEIIEKIKYSPKTTHELLYILLQICLFPLWIAVVVILVTISDMIAN